MGNTREEHAKLLFVLSNDFGELSNVMHLVMGYEFRPVVLMPERLFAVNTDTLALPHYRYSTCRDVTDHIENDRPDIVFLFSGYLYSINNIFSIDSLEALTAHLRRERHRIVTSDPFLGILSNLNCSIFSDRHPRKRWLMEHFSRLSSMLQDIPHLYLGNGGECAGSKRIHFFNKNIVLQPSVRSGLRRELARWVDLDAARERWLFVLSLEDYGLQVGLHGRARFDEMLIQKLQQTTREGRQPVLVAPQACIDSLEGKDASIEGSILLSFCGYHVFRLLALEAEHGFYWNIFSNSVLSRVMNHLPVYFFDPGHMVRAIPPLFASGMKQYYAGSEPVYLKLQADLESEELAVLGAKQERTMSGARENFWRSPGPDEVVEELLAGKA